MFPTKQFYLKFITYSINIKLFHNQFPVYEVFKNIYKIIHSITFRISLKFRVPNDDLIGVVPTVYSMFPV